MEPPGRAGAFLQSLTLAVSALCRMLPGVVGDIAVIGQCDLLPGRLAVLNDWLPG
jgi:hypothetical protein